MNVYRINVKICGSAYIKARSEEEAKRILAENLGEPGLGGTDDVRNTVSDAGLDDIWLPEFSLSPAMTYYGPWEGETMDLAEENVPSAEDEEDETIFLNHYRCTHADTPHAGAPPDEWEDEWSCMCNDRCPTCNVEVEPYESEELGDEQDRESYSDTQDRESYSTGGKP